MILSVSWQIDTQGESFTEFGQRLMRFLRDNRWEFTGVMEVLPELRQAKLLGRMVVSVEEDEFFATWIDFLLQNSWALRGQYKKAGV